MIEKTENNENISDASREALLSALIALKELVEDQLETQEIDEEVMEVIEGLLE